MARLFGTLLAAEDEFNYPEADKYKPIRLADRTHKIRKAIRKEKPSARLRRVHKIMVHAAVITAIALSLTYEGGKLADWLFVGLSILAEAN